MESRNTRACLQTGRSAKEDTPVTDDLSVTDQENPKAAACSSCGKTFSNLRGLATHKARWCKEQRVGPEPYKPNDGIQNQESHHSVQESIDQPDAKSSTSRIKWPTGAAKTEWKGLDEDLTRALDNRLKECDSCDIATQLKTFTDIVVQTCTERLGIEERTEKKVVEKRPNRRQVQKGKLRTRERQLKKALQEAPDNEKPGINELLNDIHKQILTLARAENHRKKKKEKKEDKR